MPYMWIETGEPKHYDGVMIDDSRIIGMTVRQTALYRLR
jgi:hypothetical protein